MLVDSCSSHQPTCYTLPREILGKAFAAQLFRNFKEKNDSESANKETKATEQLEISQMFLNDTLKCAMQYSVGGTQLGENTS